MKWMSKGWCATVLLLTVAIQAYSQTFTQELADSSLVNQWNNRDSSRFRSELSSADSATKSSVTQQPLTPFGYDLFSRPASEVSSQNAEVMVLPPNYRLGPGDRLGVYLLGNVQKNLDVTVNVEGKILAPPAGVVEVWGRTLDEFKSLLVRKLFNYYDNVDVDVMLLQPKNVTVAIVGDVRRPGKYVLSALNTVLDAVVTAGGPTPKGSIRDIRLIREGERYASVDLYQFLMNGKNDFDAFLQTGDRIQVPLAQSKIEVSGEVKRPSIFELKPGFNERLSDVIKLAGGFTELAYLDKIEMSRLQDSGHRQLIYVDYRSIAEGDSTQDLLLQHDDRVHVYSKLEQIHERQVAIYGEVRRPGTYPLEDNMHLSDLILKAGNLTEKAYTLEAEIAKVDPGKPTRFYKVNLQEMRSGTNGHNDLILEDDDQVFIREIPDWEVGLMVEVRGEVQFPGKYPIMKDSTYLSEILAKAGGFTEEAFLQEAVVIRPSTRIRFDKEFERLRTMRREDMSDLEYQYLVMRQNSADVDQIVVDFEKLVYQNDKSQDVVLEDGDIITIPKAPKTVKVTGRVARPGGVAYRPGARLDYYLAKAGGASWDANPGKTKVIKVTGSVLDDEDVNAFEAGDIIWVPRKSDRKFWPIFLQSVTVAAQLASIYLIIDTAANR